MEDIQPPAKRIKLDDGYHKPSESTEYTTCIVELLPPSWKLLPKETLSNDSQPSHIEEVDVGISEYISKSLPEIQGIIKQRWAL